MLTKRSVGVSKIGASLAMAVMGISALSTQVYAADVQKLDNTLLLNDVNAWQGSAVPTNADTALFDSLLSTQNTFSLGDDLQSWLGIKILNPASGITINSGNLLTLGAGGIDMTNATQNFTIGAGLNITANQTWGVASGLTLLVNGTVGLGDNTVTVTGPGNTRINGGLLGGAGSLEMRGTGTLTLASQNTYAGLTSISSGVLLLDFNALGAAAPASNIVSSSSTLTLGGGKVEFKGNGTVASSQTFAATRINGGFTTISTPSVGAGLTVQLGAITASSQNNGALIRFDSNTAGAVKATSAPNRSGLNVIANNNGGMFATFGLYDWAALDPSGNVVASGSPGTTAYTPVGPGNNGGVTGLIDIMGGGNANLNANADYTAVRFNTNSTSQNVTGINNGRFGGFLMTPNVGAQNVTVSGPNMRTLNQNNSNAQVNFWQNNTQGTLTIAASMGGNGAGYVYSKAGQGLVIFTSGTKKAGGGIFIYEGELRVDANDQLGTGTNGSLVNLFGGTLGIGGAANDSVTVSVFNSSGGIQHPILVGPMGGGIHVTGESTFTVTGSSNSAISGTGLLTKSGTGTLNLVNTASSWSGGFAINGGTVNVQATTGTPLGTGPVNVNNGGSLLVSGVLPGGFTVNAGGSWLVGNGTINGAVTLKPGAIVGGTGAAGDLSLGTGVIISPGTTDTIGVLNVQNLTLSSGSILDFNLQAVPKDSDKINILTGGSLTLGSGVVINMFYNGASSEIPFFSNGSYVLFTGVDVTSPGTYAGGATQGILSNFVAANFQTNTGASAVFSIINPGTSSSIIVTITGALTVANWTAAGVPGDWSDDANWDTGAPGGSAGDIASLTGATAPSTINLNGPVKLGTLGIDSGTNNTGYTLAAGSGGKLFVNNGTLPAKVVVVSGIQTISADVEVDSPSTFTAIDPISALVITGQLSNLGAGSTLLFSGAGKTILTANNTV
ncbi:MAG TPA: autotransporter-associated beta strand repeat-containing protein, partial [Phycisphaerae bacterium]|nr:autotransporter-associated beta strand repeat-containing protein [Phycisphaerae bacterium]